MNARLIPVASIGSVRELRSRPALASSAGEPHEFTRLRRRTGEPLSLVTFFGGAKKVTGPLGLNRTYGSHSRQPLRSGK